MKLNHLSIGSFDKFVNRVVFTYIQGGWFIFIFTAWLRVFWLRVFWLRVFWLRVFIYWLAGHKGKPKGKQRKVKESPKGNEKEVRRGSSGTCAPYPPDSLSVTLPPGITVPTSQRLPVEGRPIANCQTCPLRTRL